MSRDDLFEKATRIVHEGDPEYLTLMADRVHKTVQMSAKQAAENPKAIRAASSALIDAYWEQREKLPFKTEEERAMAGPAIIGEMIGILCISWATSSLARSVGEGVLAKPLVDDPSTRQATIEALSRSNFAVYTTLIKHCIEGISKNKLHIDEMYEHFLPPEMRGKAN
jgi:hypothetical protein